MLVIKVKVVIVVRVLYSKSDAMRLREGGANSGELALPVNADWLSISAGIFLQC
jgi:hypothetical protein